jgi:hypothetical protein
MKCIHAPARLFDRPKTATAALTSVLMHGHRVGYWRHCHKCGKVGLASRNTGRIHSWIERPELVEKAAEFNKWNKANGISGSA